MFFNRKKDKDEPIILDCYTNSTYAYNHAKINHARHYIPDWWRKTKHMLDEQTPDGEGIPTVKMCPAIRDYYLKGIVMPLWGELEITLLPYDISETAPSYTWRSSNLDFDTNGSHNRSQFKGFAGRDGVNLKLSVPWFFKCREFVHFTSTQPVWSQPEIVDELTLLPGVVDFKNQHALQLNYFFRQRDIERQVTIAPLTPMVILHPMSERPIELRTHYIDSKAEWRAWGSNPQRSGMFLDIPNGGAEGFRKLKKYYKKRNKFWEKRDKIDKTPFI